MTKLKYASDRFTRQIALMDHFVNFSLTDLHYDLKEGEWMKGTDIGRYRGRRLHRQKACQVIPLKDELRTVFERHNGDTFFRLEKRMQEAYHRFKRQGCHVFELGWALDGMRSKPLERYIEEVIREMVQRRRMHEDEYIAPACISLAKVQWLLAINNSSVSSKDEVMLEAAYFLRFTIHWVTCDPKEAGRNVIRKQVHDVGWTFKWKPSTRRPLWEHPDLEVYEKTLSKNQDGSVEAESGRSSRSTLTDESRVPNTKLKLYTAFAEGLTGTSDDTSFIGRARDLAGSLFTQRIYREAGLTGSAEDLAYSPPRELSKSEQESVSESDDDSDSDSRRSRRARRVRRNIGRVYRRIPHVFGYLRKDGRGERFRGAETADEMVARLSEAETYDLSALDDPSTNLRDATLGSIRSALKIWAAFMFRSSGSSVSTRRPYSEERHKQHKVGFAPAFDVQSFTTVYRARSSSRDSTFIRSQPWRVVGRSSAAFQPRFSWALALVLARLTRSAMCLG
ncbi:hypothetical protein HD553DRAFT_326346 [Filobasidium floriforme]|uniref:uncharacterized protein n=1 Tax=Filobasidium floriforme TaxID=5210 RepID=UPI001E8E35C2|nr:uncharacterized protein HD553DRAFT_326346 [Filobasidium floriforme]KAH8079619.1 hypothetical protein HD553DRAFT_326346 [Filobasidium floriforme]